MIRYTRKFKEEDDTNNNGIPDWLDDKISEVLQELRDGNFGNAEGRQEFLDLVTTLFNSKDKRARKAFKAISELFTDIGDELIKYGQPEELEESSKYKPNSMGEAIFSLLKTLQKIPDKKLYAFIDEERYKPNYTIYQLEAVLENLIKRFK
jgi:hypothetical protein